MCTRFGTRLTLRYSYRMRGSIHAYARSMARLTNIKTAAYRSTRFWSARIFSMVGRAACQSFSEASKEEARKGAESKPNTAFSFWCAESRRSPMGACPV